MNEAPGRHRLLPPLRGLHRLIERTMVGAHLPLRRAYLWLLVAVMLPLMLVGIGRSIIDLRNTQRAVEAALSARALETARGQAVVVRTTRSILTLLAALPDVRGGGILCDVALMQADEDFVALTNVSRWTAAGALMCSSAHPLRDLRFAQYAMMPDGQPLRGFAVRGPIWGLISQRQVLIAMVPVKTAGGTHDGMITASIDMGWMRQELRREVFGADSIAMLVDGTGRAHASNRKLPFGRVDVRVAPGTVATLTDTTGRRWTYAVAPLVTIDPSGAALFVVYAMPEARLFSAAWLQAGFVVLQPLIAVLVVGLAIWVGTSVLVLRWMRELGLLADEFSAGDYRARPGDFDAAPAEFRLLAATLVKMGRAIDNRDSELRAALEHQSQLVREIHHRVKNNLQIVMSLLSLHAGRQESESGRSAILQTRLRVNALALVHRLAYETGEQGAIRSRELFGGVCDLVSRSVNDRPDIDVTCDFADVDLDLDRANPLALWLIEAASNALLHGFPDGRGGQVALSFAVADDQAQLVVADDGVGMPAGTADTGAARGLRMLAGIARQLGGSLEVTQTPGGGTTAALHFALQAPAA